MNSLQDTWDNIKKSNVHVIGDSGEQKETEAEKYLTKLDRLGETQITLNTASS